MKISIRKDSAMNGKVIYNESKIVIEIYTKLENFASLNILYNSNFLHIIYFQYFYT